MLQRATKCQTLNGVLSRRAKTLFFLRDLRASVWPTVFAVHVCDDQNISARVGYWKKKTLDHSRLIVCDACILYRRSGYAIRAMCSADCFKTFAGLEGVVVPPRPGRKLIIRVNIPIITVWTCRYRNLTDDHSRGNAGNAECNTWNAIF